MPLLTVTVHDFSHGNAAFDIAVMPADYAVAENFQLPHARRFIPAKGPGCGSGMSVASKATFDRRAAADMAAAEGRPRSTASTNPHSRACAAETG